MKDIAPQLLSEIVQRIVKIVHPQKIFLYGSHAYGQPHDDSDIDLLVVVESSTIPSRKRAAIIYSALRGLFLPVEAKVDTIEEFEHRSHWLSSIERVVAEKGRVLYESPA